MRCDYFDKRLFRSSLPFLLFHGFPRMLPVSPITLTLSPNPSIKKKKLQSTT